jgi:hypothetical protein
MLLLVRLRLCWVALVPGWSRAALVVEEEASTLLASEPSQAGVVDALAQELGNLAGSPRP